MESVIGKRGLKKKTNHSYSLTCLIGEGGGGSKLSQFQRMGRSNEGAASTKRDTTKRVYWGEKGGK